MTTRRTFLAGSGAAVASAVCPALPAMPVSGAPRVAAPLVCWIVGIEDQPHDLYWADSKAEAIAMHLDQVGLDRCETGLKLGASCEDDDCEECRDVDSVDAGRAPKLDRIPPERRNKLRNADYARAGFNARCDRCEASGRRYLAWDDDSGDVCIIHGDTVCDDCLHHEPLANIRLVAPGLAAEIEDELLTVEYGEAA
jgi:hypothetical protein